MQIDRNLSLVFPLRSVEKPDPSDTTYEAEHRDQKTMVEVLIWAYHTPISLELFRQYFRVIGATKDALFSKGPRYAAQTGVTIADLELIEAAKAVSKEYGTPDVGPMLLAELRRLTMVLAPRNGGAGFEHVPSEIAVQRDVITEDEWHDAECVIIFFTCASTMVLRASRGETSEAAASLLKGSMTSLSATEFAESLAISTRAATSVKSETSLVPS